MEDKIKLSQAWESIHDCVKGFKDISEAKDKFYSVAKKHGIGKNAEIEASVVRDLIGDFGKKLAQDRNPQRILMGKDGEAVIGPDEYACVHVAEQDESLWDIAKELVEKKEASPAADQILKTVKLLFNMNRKKMTSGAHAISAGQVVTLPKK